MWTGLALLWALLLDHNLINNIHPGAFSQLKLCEVIDLRGNNLSVIRQDMWVGADHLQTLCLQKNYLTMIMSDTFFHLTSLEKLLLAENNIIHFEENSLSNQYLSRVDLHGNKFTTLSELVFGQIHLENLELTLGGNPLHCDGNLVWIKIQKQDRRSWQIQRDEFLGSGPAEPECENYPGVAWSDVQLDDSTLGGKNQKHHFFVPLQ